eukprot:15333727-Ditylum_brightwellii.AAC.1
MKVATTNGAKSSGDGATSTTMRRRRRRWDDASAGAKMTKEEPNNKAVVSDTESTTVKTSGTSRWDDDVSTASSVSTQPRRRKRWDETPVVASGAAATATVSSFAETPLVLSGQAPDATPLVTGNSAAGKWDETPLVAPGASMEATPAVGVNVEVASGGRKRSRWDSTPAPQQISSTATPMIGGHASPATPLSGDLAKALAIEREMETRNRPWTAAALDAILPAEGYSIVPPPSNYVPLRTPSRKLLATPTPMGMTPAGFQMAVPVEDRQGEGGQSLQDIREAYGVPIAATSAEGAP